MHRNFQCLPSVQINVIVSLVLLSSCQTDKNDLVEAYYLERDAIQFLLNEVFANPDKHEVFQQGPYLKDDYLITGISEIYIRDSICYWATGFECQPKSILNEFNCEAVASEVVKKYPMMDKGSFIENKMPKDILIELTKPINCADLDNEYISLIVYSNKDPEKGLIYDILYRNGKFTLIGLSIERRFERKYPYL